MGQEPDLFTICLVSGGDLLLYAALQPRRHVLILDLSCNIIGLWLCG